MLSTRSSLGLVTTADDEKEASLPVHDTHHKYAFLNDGTKNDNGSKVINLLIQARERKEHDCEKANHNVEMISKKRLEKQDGGLMVMINQMQAHHSGKKKDCESAKTNNAAERFQEQKLKPYSGFVSRNTQQNRKVLTVEVKCRPW